MKKVLTPILLLAALVLGAAPPAAAQDARSCSTVGVLYHAALHRAADPAGLAFWEGEIEAGRITLDQVVALFLAAPERSEIPPAERRILLEVPARTVALPPVTAPAPESHAHPSWADDWPVPDVAAVRADPDGFAEGVRLSLRTRPDYQVIIHRHVRPVNQPEVFFLRLAGQPFSDPPMRMTRDQLRRAYQIVRRAGQ